MPKPSLRTIRKQRFERDALMSRIQLHLANRTDQALPWPEFRALLSAREIVAKAWLAALDDELKQINQGNF